MSRRSLNSPAISRRLKCTAAALLVIGAGLTSLALWFAGVTIGQRDPLFHGQPESQWIKNLKYSDDEQVKEWRGYGGQGIQVLIRGLEQANRPGERAYRRLYRHLPGLVVRWLPAPKPDSTRALRMCLGSLLSSLGSEAASARSVMARTLVHDEDDSVREIAITYFTGSEDAKCPLNQMTPAERRELLPALMQAFQNKARWGLRNNAAIALQYYSEEKEVVVPVLVNGLQDPQPHVRLLAAEALNRLDPGAAQRAGAAAVVAAIMKDPDDQIASRAAGALRDFQTEPELAVRALAEGLESTNTLVACQSVWSLQQFKGQAAVILPALERATRRTDSAARYAELARKQFAGPAGTKSGAK